MTTPATATTPPTALTGEMAGIIRGVLLLGDPLHVEQVPGGAGLVAAILVARQDQPRRRVVTAEPAGMERA